MARNKHRGGREHASKLFIQMKSQRPSEPSNMREAFKNNVSKNGATRPFKRVYEQSKSLAPVLVPGGIIALAIFLVAKTQQITPAITEIQPAPARRAHYFFETIALPSEQEKPEVKELVENLSPKMEMLRREIIHLKETDTKKWEQQKSSIIQAWQQMGEHYKMISDALSKG